MCWVEHPDLLGLRFFTYYAHSSFSSSIPALLSLQIICQEFVSTQAVYRFLPLYTPVLFPSVTNVAFFLPLDPPFFGT